MNANAELSTEPLSPPIPEAEARDRATPAWRRWILPAIGLYFIVAYALAVYWSIQSAPFDPQTVAMERVGNEEARLAPGVVAVSTVSEVARTLLEKPGGYIYNDRLLPGILLDNMPSWEYGVVKEVRDSVRALRNDFSRSQTQSVENIDLRQADGFLNYDVDSWILPASEQEYWRGIEALERYLTDLQQGTDPSARFFARADNLAAYLAVVEKRLGSYAQRLSASVGDDELTAALVGGNAGQVRPEGAPELRVKTPWMEIDDVFYEARGYSWALLHMFKALAIEFEPVLADKNAKVSVQQVIRDLEDATVRMWSPVVLNGHGFGLVSNHSLILASYLSRANAAVLDLRILLQQG